jgi:hypothetical protein
VAEVTARATVWLQSVFGRLPATIRAVYVEYGDAVTPDQEHLVYFNAFGFASLAGGRFDPANSAHLCELGEFTWEPPDECDFRVADHPGADWLAVLRAAAGSPEVAALAASRGVRLIVGEHDCEVFVIV